MMTCDARFAARLIPRSTNRRLGTSFRRMEVRPMTGQRPLFTDH